MEQLCPTCGQQSPGDSIFCIYCGNKLEITAISTKVSQFRFPSMRSSISGSIGNTGYNSPVGTGGTGNTRYNSPVNTDNIDNPEYNSPVSTGGTDNPEYNSPVGGGTGNIAYDSPVNSGGAGNVGYDLPTGWITSNPEYNSPGGGVAGSIGYDVPVNSGAAANVGYDVPTGSGGVDNIEFELPIFSGGTGNIVYNLPVGSNGADNIGYDLPVSSDGRSNNAYGSLVNPGHPSENNWQRQVQQAQSAVASALGPVQLGSMLKGIHGRLPRHAFAGRGSRMTHHSWLLEGEYLNAAKLHSSVVDLLSQRNFQTLKLNVEKLQERGHWAEERDYIVMQQGITSVFLYVAPAGQNLYISRTTTVQPPFNPFRIFLLIFALGEILFGPSVLSNLLSSLTMHRSVGAGIALIVPITVAILLIPSILFLVTFFLASLRHWFTEKDFWVYLRRNTLNDFEIDDILLLEHATDDAVRSAVDQLKLDATKIIPPVAGYQPGRRIRII